MTQNPYANPGAPGLGGYGESPFDTRTSIMAIVSLVLGIISIPLCCVGAIPGVLAGGFGIASVIAVSRDTTGRLQGRGLAVGGIVTGTIGLFLNIVIWFGAATVYKAGAQILQAPLTGVEQADVRPLQEILHPTAAARLDEAKMLAFRDAYQAKFGKFVKIDTNLFSGFSAVKSTFTNERVESIMKSSQLAPFPAWGEFEKGRVLIWFLVPQQNRVTSGNKPAFVMDVLILPPDGEPIRLLGDPPPQTPATPSSPSTPSTQPDAGAKPNEPPAEPKGGA